SERFRARRQRTSELFNQLELPEGGDDAAFVAGRGRSQLDLAGETFEQRVDAAAPERADVHGVCHGRSVGMRWEIGLRPPEDPGASTRLGKTGPIRGSARVQADEQ